MANISGNVTTLLNRTIIATDKSFADAEASMVTDSICLLRGYAHKSDYPGSGNTNWQGIIFKGEGSRYIRICSNGTNVWIKTGPSTNSWSQIV